MTGTDSLAATPGAAKPRIRPATVLPLMLLLIIIVKLVAPKPQNQFGDTYNLTTYSAGPFGARGIYDVLARLGWRTSRQLTPFSKEMDPSAVYAIVSPARPLDPSEDSILVRFVRNGGRLLLIYEDSALTTQFGMWSGMDSHAPAEEAMKYRVSAAGDSAKTVHRDGRKRPLAPNILWRVSSTVNVLPPVDDTLAIFLWHSPFQHDSATAPPLILGRNAGRGRVVLVADPVFLTNDFIREGQAALAVQRAIEWLDPPNRRIIFDEYHQGYGQRAPSVTSVLLSALTDTAPGRVALQVVVAGLILLIAIGIRPILPTPITTFQRRSPLEHVDALARAYAQIHATRLGTQRLIRGLRRRHPMGINAWGDQGDVAYMEAVRARYRTDPDDIATLSTALQQTVGDEEFLKAGQAAGRIEHSITTQ